MQKATLKRWVAGGGGLVCVIALCLAAPAPATAAGRPAISTPRCATTSLRIWVGRTSTAAGSVTAEYGFTSHGSGDCSLRGYPRVQMLKASGKNLSTSYAKAAPGTWGIKVKTVVLAKGETAYFGVIYHNSTGYAKVTCPTSAGLRFTPPQNTRVLILRGAHGHIAAYGGTTKHLVCGGLRATLVSAKPLIKVQLTSTDDPS